MPRVVLRSPEVTQASLASDSNSSFARFAWITLAYTIAVILEGAFVRATGSGAGCGNHWPLCNGQLVFGTPSSAKAIEFAHRSMTGIDGAFIVWLLVWAFRKFPKHHPVRLGAALSTLFLVTEALIGAALVKFGLVVNDPSAAHAAVLSLHLANTLTLVAFLTLTAWWAAHPRIRLNARAWASLVAFTVLGITGALAALADTLYPAHSLAAAFAQDLNPQAGLLVRLRAMHPFVAAAVGLWLMYYASLRGARTQAVSRAVIALVVLQLLAGALNLLLLAPVAMQLIHLLLADLLWIALVALCASPDAA
jgi:heme A synthase